MKINNVPSIKVGILGLGTVGTGVYKVLVNNSANIAQKVGVTLEVKKILERDLDRDRGIAIPRELFTQDLNEILDDPEINIVVEVLGGIEFAREAIIAALGKGKNVITANKDLIAIHGQEILAIAEENQRDFLFEASVGGGIPIIRPLKVCLAANNISQVIGIVNGTTNYMLTKMEQTGMAFDEVLKEAQELGYAEANPASDVEGYDAARKLAILASIAFGTRVTFNDVNVEGITKITPLDIKYAQDLGCRVKLLAIAKETDNQVEVRVHPTFIPLNHPLAAVNDVFNAIFVTGDAVGDTMFYGRGAGELPTASAIVGDVMEAARNTRLGVNNRIGCTCFNEKKIKDIGESVSKYYLRMLVKDQPGVLASITGALGEMKVSISSMVQKRTEGTFAELVFITHLVKDKNLRDALKAIESLPTVEKINNVIRVEGDDI